MNATTTPRFAKPAIRTLPVTYFPKDFDVRVFVAGLSDTFAPLPPSSGSPLPTVNRPLTTAASDRYRAAAEYWAADLAREVSNRVAQLKAVCGAHRMPAEAINHLDAAIHSLRAAIQHGNANSAAPIIPAVADR